MTESTEHQKASESFDADIVRNLAVTEMKEDVFEFRWHVKQFRQRLLNKKLFSKLKSPLFKFKEDPEIQCQLVIYWSNIREISENFGAEDEYLSVYLHLANLERPRKVEFQLYLITANNSLTMASADHTEYKFLPTKSGWGCEKMASVYELLNPESKLLEADTLKIFCRVIKRQDTFQFQGVRTDEERVAAKRKHEMISDYSNLYKSKALADVVIMTKNSKLNAHKTVLSCRSPVFLAMFQNQMSESVTNTVQILDFEDEIVTGMLEYIYCGEISETFLNERPSDLLQISEKYDVKGLKAEAEEIMILKLSIENVSLNIMVADMNNALKLKEKAIEFLILHKKDVLKTEGFQELLNYKNACIFKDIFLAH